MGFIRRSFGKVTVETRPWTFYLVTDDCTGKRISPELDYSQAQEILNAIKDLIKNDAQFKHWKKSERRYSV